MYGNLKYMWDMKDYKAIKRLLERLGFVHVAGMMRRAIRKHRMATGAAGA